MIDISIFPRKAPYNEAYADIACLHAWMAGIIDNGTSRITERHAFKLLGYYAAAASVETNAKRRKRMADVIEIIDNVDIAVFADDMGSDYVD